MCAFNGCVALPLNLCCLAAGPLNFTLKREDNPEIGPDGQEYEFHGYRLSELEHDTKAMLDVINQLKCYGNKPATGLQLTGFISGRAGMQVTVRDATHPSNWLCMHQVHNCKHYYVAKISDSNLLMHYGNLDNFKTVFEENAKKACGSDVKLIVPASNEQKLNLVVAYTPP